MAAMLLERGADPGAAGSDGLTIAAVAQKYGQSGFAEWWASLSFRAG